MRPNCSLSDSAKKRAHGYDSARTGFSVYFLLTCDVHGEDHVVDEVLVAHVVDDRLDVLHGDAAEAQAKDAVEVGQSENALQRK